MRKPIPLLAFFLLVGIASAGTVTLTGTCQNLVLNNTINFTLSNSGNDTAFNLFVVPYVKDAVVAGNYTAASLGPNSTSAFRIRLVNVTAKGTYTDYSVAAYQQGGSYFTSVFPCRLDFGNATSSQLGLSVNVTRLQNELRVNVSVFNFLQSNVTANLSLILPPSISILNKTASTLSVGPKQVGTYFFLSLPPPGQSYSASAVADYTKNGVHYSTFRIFSISTPSSALHVNFLYLGVGGAIVVVLILIVLALIRSRGKKRKSKSS